MQFNEKSPHSASGQKTLSENEFKLLTQSAESGNADAQQHLGMLYANGEGVELDYARAFKWIDLAAEQKHPQAIRTLAWLYANGFGTEQNDPQAQRLIIQLAEAGNPKDQYFLASLYQSGLYGMEPDSEKMIYWYYQAAQQHYARAQYALAKIILKGVYIKPNDEMAFQWLSLADINGHKKAGEELQKLMQRLPADIVEGYKQRMRETIEASMSQSGN